VSTVVIHMQRDMRNKYLYIILCFSQFY